MSEGNAHPYSWSSIINGHFDGNEISTVGYPGVTDYLQANKDTLGIDNAEVTHVWTQDREISESIAKSGKIKNIMNELSDMIPYVDAVILARDDPEFHVEMASPFIEEGIPIFIDKPLAITISDLEWFAKHEQNGSFIMSCSSMRYANECRTLKTEINKLGKIELITAVGKKDWIKYGVHLLEAIFAILDDPKTISVQNIGSADKAMVHIVLDNQVQVIINIFKNISPTFQLSVFGENDWRKVEIKNSYSMFRDNIIEFIRSVESGKSRLSFQKTENIIRTLIAAQESLLFQGKIIHI